MHSDLEYVKSLEKEIDELESEKADFSNIYDLLLEECVSKDVTCSYLHSLSDLNANTELQCLYLHKVKNVNVLEPKAPNNSQVKFQKKEVEDHHRISSISKKTKSVTACNDSSNSRTSNENVVCAECGKCVFNSNHDACVSRYLKDVNARTKKPNVVPISASKPKRKVNKSVILFNSSYSCVDSGCTKAHEGKSYAFVYFVENFLEATEFLNKNTPCLFKEEGIEHQIPVSPLKQPEQNGKTVPLLLRRSITMLSASKLPLSFWAEANKFVEIQPCQFKQEDNLPQNPEVLCSPLTGRFYVHSLKGSYDPRSSRKRTPSDGKPLYGLKQAPRATDTKLADMFHESPSLRSVYNNLVRRIGMRCLTPADLSSNK
ncbi:hypothetical protein Tco_0899751 [Tanacetum coccineum]